MHYKIINAYLNNVLLILFATQESKDNLQQTILSNQSQQERRNQDFLHLSRILLR